ncbi:MAG: peptidoglycan DD-metalloendopeptidase family protein [Bacteroidales bacterium]|nr:peptidoglycan DD-metalloendopeptidase family protein [Bacteroidales bacterium]
MTFKHVFTGAVSLFAALSLLAQENSREADSLRHSFGRASVPSQVNRGSHYADTLDTGNPAVKVVLYNNGTYRYIRDIKAAQSDQVFTEFWDTRAVNPYNQTPEPIPDRFSLWIVDTLDSYCCPNKTHPRSQFGYRHGRRHQGIDLPYPSGTPVPATFDGKVRISSYIGGYGNLVVIRHANGLETFYGHLSRRDVQAGDWVSAGDIIGLGGSTGRSSGPHLHFETRYRGAAFDPAWLIDFETGTLRHRLLKIRSWYFNPNQRYVQSVDDEDEIFRTDEEDRLLAEEQARKEAAERAAAEAAAMRYHTVREGDTLSSIARKYNTSVRALCQMNGMKQTDILRVGRRLRVR